MAKSEGKLMAWKKMRMQWHTEKEKWKQETGECEQDQKKEENMKQHICRSAIGARPA